MILGPYILALSYGGLFPGLSNRFGSYHSEFAMLWRGPAMIGVILVYQSSTVYKAARYFSSRIISRCTINNPRKSIPKAFGRLCSGLSAPRDYLSEAWFTAIMTNRGKNGKE
jgi:hypothetical protein